MHTSFHLSVYLFTDKTVSEKGTLSTTRETHIFFSITFNETNTQ